MNGKTMHYIFPHARIKITRDSKDHTVSGKGNQITFFFILMSYWDMYLDFSLDDYPNFRRHAFYVKNCVLENFQK